MAEGDNGTRPLEGVCVVEMGSLLAGPFCGQLLADFGGDVVVENFRPGTLEKWGLGYEALSRINPGLVMVRVSGYGQTGPYKDQAGVGSIGEAMGGVKDLAGDPHPPPPRGGGNPRGPPPAPVR